MMGDLARLTHEQMEEAMQKACDEQAQKMIQPGILKIMIPKALTKLNGKGIKWRTRKT